MKKQCWVVILGLLLVGCSSAEKKTITLKSVKSLKSVQSKAIPESTSIQKTAQAFHQLAPKLSTKAIRLALHAYQHAKARGLTHKSVLTIIDYSKPSSEKRLWVLDLKHHSVPFYTYVAHGRGSGALLAKTFSNRVNSKATSIGTYLTKNTYYGHRGYALRLQGLEKGYNDKALRRAVVIHGANYVSTGFLHRVGRMGRSWGCPALSKALTKPIINTIKQGTVLFAYYPLKGWLAHSRWIV